MKDELNKRTIVCLEKDNKIDKNSFNKAAECSVKKEKNTNNENDIFFRIVGFQIFICAVVSAFLLCFKFVSPERYGQVRSKLKLSFCGPDFKTGLLDSIDKAKGLFYGNIAANEAMAIDGQQDNCKVDDENLKNSSETSQGKPGNIVCNSESENSGKHSPSEASVEPFNNIVVGFEGEEKSFDDGSDYRFYNLKQPLDGKVCSKYGERKNPIGDNKKNEFHYGVDIPAKEGTPIFAISDGVVVKVTNSQKSGKCLTIKYDDLETIYAHCCEILVSQGANVTAGSIVAKSGKTGNVTGPHLHLGTKINGQWVDPSIIFPKLRMI